MLHWAETHHLIKWSLIFLNQNMISTCYQKKKDFSGSENQCHEWRENNTLELRTIGPWSYKVIGNSLKGFFFNRQKWPDKIYNKRILPGIILPKPYSQPH